MKSFLLATVGLVALVGMAAPASAADMAVKAPPPAPLPIIYNWSGFYIGANGGWGQSRNCWDFLDVAGVAFASGCRERSGGLIGGQIGYRWQASQWVFGLEAQGDWADLSNQRVSMINPAFSTRTKTDGIGLFTGQIGYAWNAALFYVKGGAAVTSNRFSILTTVNNFELAAAIAGHGGNGRDRRDHWSGVLDGWMFATSGHCDLTSRKRRPLRQKRNTSRPTSSGENRAPAMLRPASGARLPLGQTRRPSSCDPRANFDRSPPANRLPRLRQIRTRLPSARFLLAPTT